MKLATFTLTVALGALSAPAVFACPDHPATSVWNDGTVRAHLIANGYKNINDVNFEEGVWTADATTKDGSHVEITLDPQTGKIIPDEGIATVSREQVLANLTALGYTGLHDVDFENGVWKVEGHDPSGLDVEVKVDPNTGKILGSDMDRVQN